jgi:hypothetical protein
MNACEFPKVWIGSLGNEFFQSCRLKIKENGFVVFLEPLQFKQGLQYGVQVWAPLPLHPQLATPRAITHSSKTTVYIVFA